VIWPGLKPSAAAVAPSLRPLVPTGAPTAPIAIGADCAAPAVPRTYSNAVKRGSPGTMLPGSTVVSAKTKTLWVSGS